MSYLKSKYNVLISLGGKGPLNTISFIPCGLFHNTLDSRYRVAKRKKRGNGKHPCLTPVLS